MTQQDPPTTPFILDMKQIKSFFSQISNDFFPPPRYVVDTENVSLQKSKNPRISGNNNSKIEIYVNVYMNNNAMKYMVIVAFILFWFVVLERWRPYFVNFRDEEELNKFVLRVLWGRMKIL